MDMVFGIIFGICIMSVFAMGAVILADGGHEKMAVVFCGPAAWVWMGILKLIDILKNERKRRKFKAILQCPDRIVRYIDSNKADIMLGCDDKEYKFVPFEYLCVKATRWPKEYRTTLGEQTVGNVRYCPKSVWKRYDEISKEDFKYAKTHQSED